MPREEFAQSQKTLFGGFVFDQNNTEEGYETLKKRLANGEVLSPYEQCLLIFPKIFGRFEENIDLDGAENRLIELMQAHSLVEVKESGIERWDWFNGYAMYQILLGTVYVYKDEYVKAAYHFISGLRTGAINVNMPYCDFIRTAMKRLDEMQIESATYSGCGFSIEDPMGSTHGNFLMANNAKVAIGNIEGKNGEIVLYRKGRSGDFGRLVRHSDYSETRRKMIDIYETYVCTPDYKIKKVTFYFDGYFTSDGGTLKVPDGFKFYKDCPFMERMKFAEIIEN